MFQPGDPFVVTVLRTAVLEFPVGTALDVSARLEASANRDLQGAGEPGTAVLLGAGTMTMAAASTRGRRRRSAKR